MSMDGIAGNFEDVSKHFVLTELVNKKLLSMEKNENFCFYDAFGGNYISNNCRSAAKFFFENVRKDSTSRLQQSVYFKIMQQKLWNAEFEKRYFGSTKWVEEVILFNHKIDNCELVYNNYNSDEVLNAKKLIFKLASKNKEKYEFKKENAYEIIEDYKEKMRMFNKGIIFIDPYWKYKRDQKGCKKIIESLMSEIAIFTGWSVLIWIPIYTEKYLNISKDIEECIRKEIKINNIICEVFKIKDEDEKIKEAEDYQNIKGVNLFLITSNEIIGKHLKEVGINCLGRSIRKKNKLYKYIYNYEYKYLKAKKRLIRRIT